MGAICSDCYGPGTPFGSQPIPWHGQHQIPNNLTTPTLNYQLPSGVGLSSRVAGVDPLEMMQVGPDPMPHVASNFHSVLPRTGVEEHFTRTTSVTVAGNKNSDANNSIGMTKSKTSTTIFGPQDDDMFNKTKYPAPQQIAASVYEPPSPERARNSTLQPRASVINSPIPLSRVPSNSQQPQYPQYPQYPPKPQSFYKPPPGSQFRA